MRLRVSRAGSEAALSGEQPPRVALVPRDNADPAIVVVWTARSATGTRLLSATSDDGTSGRAGETVVRTEWFAPRR
jgi:hypothetical protein